MLPRWRRCFVGGGLEGSCRCNCKNGKDWWPRSVAAFREGVAAEEEAGSSFSEMLSLDGGKQQLDVAMERGDVWEKEGFFFCRRKKALARNTKREGLKHTVKRRTR